MDLLSASKTVLVSRFLGLLTLILSLQFAIALAGIARKEPSDKLGRPSPKLVLAASPAFGFAPLNVQLVATLNGIDPQDANFCHAAVTWVRVDTGASPEKETRITEAPRCVHEGEEPSVPTTFSKSFELLSPGSFLYRVRISGKDGKEVHSNYVTIKVLRIP